jgi:hypothetical protein
VKPQTNVDLEESADESDSLGDREQQLNEEAWFNQ